MNVATDMHDPGHAPIRLAVIFPSTEVGGCERYALTVAKHALDEGWSVDVFFPLREQTDALRDEFKRAGAAVHALEIAETGKREDQLRVRHLVRFLRSLFALRRVRPDVCLSANPSIQYLSGSIFACAALGIPTLVCFQYVQSVYTFGERRIRRYAKARQSKQTWVCVSENNRAILAESFNMPESDVQVIYNGSTPRTKEPDPAQKGEVRKKVRREMGLSEEHLVFLTVAALRAQKGHAYLISAMKTVSERYPEARWIFAGEGPERPRLDASLRQLKLEDRVSLLGQREDIEDLLLASDFFVFPTLFEGHPFALIEAMSVGLPVICTHASGITEIVTHGEHGVLCEPGNSVALARAMLRAVAHPDEARTMAQNARRRAAEFSEQRMLDQTFAALTALLGQRAMR